MHALVLGLMVRNWKRLGAVGRRARQADSFRL